ncbi:tetratricopeptide repeat protein [Falsihalocynthiibacter sp. SS001]|uniref:tetratricopeptide repeat protein n=1 Tax=Falsihalocynthiibacter sp. SS001 TaxID=3349698 RepID=UPI0036D40EF1
MKHSVLRAALLSTALLFPSANVQAEGLAGAYLAARSASTAADFKYAATYFSRALIEDPGNSFLLNSGIAANLSLGKLDTAVVLARALESKGEHSPVADLALAVQEVVDGDYEALSARIADGAEIGPVVTQLFDAWAELGAGKMSSALEKFEALTKLQGMEGVANYHKALALGSVGDFEGAAEIFRDVDANGFSHTRSTLTAYVQVLSQLERNDQALEELSRVYQDGTADPEFEDLKQRLEAGETLPFAIAPTPREGIAQAALTLAEVLSVEGTPDQTILYSRAAELLDPNMISAVLLSAAMLEDLEQFELATQAYAKVPADSPSFHLAEIGRAETLEHAGKPEEAIKVLRDLAEVRPDLPIVQVSLADTLRGQEDYQGASEAYDAALELFPEVDPKQWFIYYARGICHERLDDFPAAEADFRQALELYPDQPQVLNYLGYSLVEKNIKLDEALEMIEKAVAARPNDGYIVDSLAWAYYKLGRYEDAAEIMERAALLEPLDPIVSDHLGDALWMVDRKIEAYFQWRRALSFEPEEKDADRIRRKLDVGLDVVLEEESRAN